MLKLIAGLMQVSPSFLAANGNSVMIGDKVQCYPGGYGEVSVIQKLFAGKFVCQLSNIPFFNHLSSFLTRQSSHRKRLHST